MKKYIGVVKWFNDSPKEKKIKGKPIGCGFIFMSLDSISEDDPQYVKDILITGKTKCRIDTDDKLVEIFFHLKGVIGQIEKGNEVEFDLTEGEGAPKAINVKKIR
jgi:cold shock CspA family protein